MRVDIRNSNLLPFLLAIATLALAAAAPVACASERRARRDAQDARPPAEITFSIPRDERISLAVYNADGKIVRELLHAAYRKAGNVDVVWDGLDYAGNPLPDGDYAWRLLGAQGLHARYVVTLGDNPDPSWEQWPGGYGGIYAVCCDGGSIYFGGYGRNSVAMVKQSLSGKRDWVIDNAFEAWQAPISLGRTADKLYALQPDGMVYRIDADTSENLGRFNAAWDARTPFIPTALSGLPAPKPDTERPPTSPVSQPTDLACSDDVIAVSYYDHDAVRWYQASTGRQIAEARVPRPLGVAFDSGGRLMAISDGSVVTMTVADKKPRTLITGVPDAYRLACDSESGDILIAEQGKTQQVVRYSSAGQFLKTYGAFGGRQLGVYNPRNFLDITSIASDGSGGFFIAEADAPRRIARIDVAGAVVAEWFGPQPSAAFALIDPEDPGTAWGETADDKLIRYRVDLSGGSWSVLGVYRCEKVPQDRDTAGGIGYSDWRILHHDNETFLASCTPPQIFRVDETAGALRPVAALMTIDPVADFPDLPDTVRHGRATRLRVLWSDANGDGVVQASELAAVPDPVWAPSSLMIVGQDFSVIAAGDRSVHAMAVQSWTSSGAPVYGAETVLPLDRGEGPPLRLNDIEPGSDRSLWTTCSLTIGNGKRLNGVVKWEASGKLSFGVGVTATREQVGQIIGVAHGCVAVADQFNRNIDVWDNDGLWVGQFLEAPDFAAAPHAAYRLAPDLIDGSLYTDPKTGDVYFVGCGVNNNPIFRITGWNDWDRQEGVVSLR